MPTTSLRGRTILYLVSEDWYFWSHRLPIARAARDAGARVFVAARMSGRRDTIAAEGFTPVHIPFDRSGIDPLRDAATVAAIVRAYRRCRPDLVHHVAAKPVLYGSLAAKICNVPNVVNAMAGMGFLFLGESRKARLLRRGFEVGLRTLGRGRRSWVIVQNRDDAAEFQRLGFPQSRVAIVRGSGVDTDAFPFCSEPPTAPPIAVCVSRMLWDKGIGELVEAARLLRAWGVPIKIRLVGETDSNPASIPAEILQTWTDEGIVDVAGPKTDIAQEYARAHIAVLPSYREGLPKALLEAASCGRAMVATDVPGCREICRDGETGLLVPARDAHALADALERLAGDASLRARLGAQARAVVEAEFAQEIVVEETMKVYERALAPGLEAS